MLQNGRGCTTWPLRSFQLYEPNPKLLSPTYLCVKSSRRFKVPIPFKEFSWKSESIPLWSSDRRSREGNIKTTPVCDAPFQAKLNVSYPYDLDGGDRERNHGPSPVFGISRYHVLYNSLTCRLASAKSRLKTGFTTAPIAAPATFPAPAAAMFLIELNKPRPQFFLRSG